MALTSATYAIGTEGFTFVRVLLGKTWFRLGEELHAWLDFTDTDWSCLQVMAALDRLEAVKPEYIIGPAYQVWLGLANPTVQGVAQIVRRFEPCINSKFLGVSLPIPRVSYPELHTEYGNNDEFVVLVSLSLADL
jgi:hypothetical protein